MGQQQTKDFPYEVAPTPSSTHSLWSLHTGTNKADKSPVTVFVFDATKHPAERKTMARDGCHRLKTLRHPNVLKYLDSVELEDKIYMVTEPVVPLRAALDQLNSTTESNTSSTKTQLELSWGLHQLSKAVSFLNNDCKLIHGNLCSSSVFVDKSGEWKLAGMDCVVPVSQTDISITASTLTYNCLPGHEKYRPPEFHKGVGAISNSLNHGNTPWSFDAWGLGCILYESFNGPLERPESLQSIGHIPKSLVPIYRAFLHSDPKSRLNPSRFITDCKLSGGFLDNPFVTACLFLEELNIKDNNEKTEFFKKLPDHIDSFPQNACRYKILPQLLIALEYSIATSSVLTSALKISSHLPPAEYEARVVPCVVKLFASPDRSMRMQLLYQLEQFHDHLKANIVNDQIFPHVANGFVDTSATLREATLKSMLLLTPKLNERTINTQLLKFFAKLQMDEVPTIRANTTICLGKIARFLSEATREKVLIAAFSRALKDPAVHSRVAGLMAFCATAEYYSPVDAAAKIIPTISPLTIDGDKQVRKQAFSSLSLFLKKVEVYAESLPDVAVAKADGSNNTSSSSSSTADGQNSSDASSSSWAGWAVGGMVGTLSKKWIGSASASTTSNSASVPTSASATPNPTSTPTLSTLSSTTSAGQTQTIQNNNTHNNNANSFNSNNNNATTPKSGMSLGNPNSSSSSSAANGWDSFEDNDDEEFHQVSKNQYNFEAPASKSGWEDNEPWESFESDGWEATSNVKSTTPTTTTATTSAFASEKKKTSITSSSSLASSSTNNNNINSNNTSNTSWTKFQSSEADSGWDSWSTDTPAITTAQANIFNTTPKSNSSTATSSTKSAFTSTNAHSQESSGDGWQDNEEFEDANNSFDSAASSTSAAATKEALRLKREELKRKREEKLKNAGSISATTSGLGAVKKVDKSL